MTDRQALLSAAGKQRPYKAVNIKPPAMPGDIYFAEALREVWQGRRRQSAESALAGFDSMKPSILARAFRGGLGVKKCAKVGE